MTPEFAYFLKVNVAFVLLYAFYRLFFYKDTFFKLRRTLLLAFFTLSLFYPLFNIQDWVREQEPMAEVIQLYSSILPEATVIADAVPVASGENLGSVVFLYVYLAIVAGLGIRFFILLGGILLLARRCKKEIIQGVSVYSLNKKSGPFSFFKLIFIHPASHSEKEISEILAHECTHVSQWHSIDVILCELIGIVCWLNPFVWLLKREVRHNLEYLADDTVLESGYDSRSYQYHLLGLAHPGRAESALFNSFNIIHIKNRISMMNKKRSRSIGRTKYLAFLPLAALLMLFSNIEAVAHITEDLTADVVSEANSLVSQAVSPVLFKACVVDRASKPLSGVKITVKGSVSATTSGSDGSFTIEAPAGAVLTLSAAGYKDRDYSVTESVENLKIQLLPEVKAPNSQLSATVDEMPEFPGGESELMKFLAKEIKYPVRAQEQNITGRVLCSFVIGKDGAIVDPVITESADPLLDKEALRVVNKMPAWKPGKDQGRAVRVQYTLPITFNLSGLPNPVSKKKNVNGIEIPEVVVVGYGADSEVHTVVDEMPEFPGEPNGLMQYLAKSIKYPTEAQEKGQQGRVSCLFIVEKNGSISNIEVTEGVNALLNNEAIRVIKAMPKWKPGKHKGQVVRTKYTVPVTFRLQ